jgi:hypothetical protein
MSLHTEIARLQASPLVSDRLDALELIAALQGHHRTVEQRVASLQSHLPPGWRAVVRGSRVVAVRERP